MEGFFQKLKLLDKIRLIKFLIIFSLTGTSSLFASDFFILFIKKHFSISLGFYYEIFFVIIFYHFLLAIFCYLFGEFPYVLAKLRRLKQLFDRF